MADTKKIIISVQVKEIGTKQVSEASQKAVKDLTKLTKAEKDNMVAAEMLRQKNIQVKSEISGLATQALNASKGLNTMKATSGLNNAILLETSRLASDANYGFQGMANNLGQLVSLLQISAQNAGGLGNVFADLKKQLFGIGGLMIGFQLLISFLPRIEKAFKKLASAVNILGSISKDVGQNARTLVGNFEIYTKTLLDSTETSEQHRIALKKLKDEYPDFNAEILLDKERTEEANAARLEYIDTLERQAISQAALTKSQELYGKIVEIEFNRELDLEKAKKKTNQAVLLRGTAVATNIDFSKTEESLNQSIQENEIKRINERADEEIAAEQKKLDILFKLIDLQDEEEKKRGGRRRRRNAAFKAADLDFEVERQRSRERILKSLVKDEQFQVDIQMQGMKDRARIKQQEFVEDQKRRFEEFKSRGVSNEQIKEAETALNKEIRTSEEELASYLIQLDKETARKRADIRLAQNKVIQDRLREQQYAEEILIQKQDDQEVLNKGIKAGNLLAIQEQQLEAERERIQMSLDAGNLEFQDKERLEKELTKVTNEQTSLRIADAEREAMSKRQLLDQVGNALSAFSDLAGKETKAGKALAISSTLVSTYSAAQKAFESQFLPIPTTNSPIRGALAAAAAVASGLANVRAIIGETKTAPSKKPSVQVEAPDFNVVGASPQSQLAASVAQQQTQPLRAFVVGKDITNQQEFDRNIATTAGL
jgi:CRISPR/Cas system-associated endoribonuclease Cas2